MLGELFMRKIIFYGILIFIFSIFTGYMYSKLWKNKVKLETVAEYSNKTYENEVKQTSSDFMEKVSYNAKFALKKQYSDCGHTIIDTSELPIEFINLTKEELMSIANKDFGITRLNQVRDLSVFAANTDLSYCDLASVKKEDIQVDG